jgi:hypothetical protein
VAIERINPSPPIALVGQKVQLAPVGSYSSALELRWYLTSAPADSKLLTLATYADLGKKREDARITPNAGGASFTPDVPGLYEVLVYPTTLYRFRRGYAGAVPAAGQSAELDNEIDALPAYAGGTAAAIPVGASAGVALSVWVAQARSRNVGFGADRARLVVNTYSDTILPLIWAGSLDGQATITGTTSSRAKLAVQEHDVRAVLQAIRETASTDSLLIVGSIIDGAIDKWNRHVSGLSFSWDTHTAADATNTLSVSSATDLATSIALLNDIRTKFSAHRALVGSVHDNADPDHAVSAPACTDLTTALALWIDLWEVINGHAADEYPHAASGSTPVDGGANEHVEAPTTEAALPDKANKLRSLYVGHISKTTSAKPHEVSDSTENVIISTADGQDGLIAKVNAWQQAIVRHGANAKADGTPAATAYHQTGGNATPHQMQFPQGASNIAGAIELAEMCMIMFERHALNDEVHNGTKAWGNGSYAGLVFSPLLSLRLQKAWMNVTQAYQSVTISNTNPGATNLQLLSGWDLQASTASHARHL